MTRQLFIMRTVAYIDGNVSLLFEILLASMPAYTMLGRMHSRVRYVNILTNQLHASPKVHPRASLKLFNDFFFFLVNSHLWKELFYVGMYWLTANFHWEGFSNHNRLSGQNKIKKNDNNLEINSSLTLLKHAPDFLLVTITYLFYILNEYLCNESEKYFPSHPSQMLIKTYSAKVPRKWFVIIGYDMVRNMEIPSLNPGM